MPEDLMPVTSNVLPGRPPQTIDYDSQIRQLQAEIEALELAKAGQEGAR
jgi:hypothetical protein